MHGPARAVLAVVVVATTLVATDATRATEAHALPEAGDRDVRQMSGGYETAVLDALSRRRERRDLRALTPSACVDEIAEARSRRMAVRDEMVHYSGLGKVLDRCGGARVGEIVARGGSFRDPAVVVRAWMDSPSHRDLIVRPSYRQAGVGAWRDDAGVVFVSVIFRAP